MASRRASPALRRLRRAPTFSLTAIATLALGIGAVAAIFALVYGVLLRPLPYPASDRLVAVRHAAPRADLAVSGLSPGTFPHYRRHNRSFEGIAVYMGYASTLTGLGAPEQVRVTIASPSLFTVLRAAPYRGRLPTAAELDSGGRSGVFISYDLWVRRYGADPDIVGQTIEIARQPKKPSKISIGSFARFRTPTRMSRRSSSSGWDSIR